MTCYPLEPVVSRRKMQVATFKPHGAQIYNRATLHLIMWTDSVKSCASKVFVALAIAIATVRRSRNCRNNATFGLNDLRGLTLRTARKQRDAKGSGTLLDVELKWQSHLVTCDLTCGVELHMKATGVCTAFLSNPIHCAVPKVPIGILYNTVAIARECKSYRMLLRARDERVLQRNSVWKLLSGNCRACA